MNREPNRDNSRRVALFSGAHVLIVIAMLMSWVFGLSAAELAVATNSVLVLGSREEARTALMAEDDFIRALSDFDRAARMKSESPVTRAQFMDFVGGEALDWTDADVAKVQREVAVAKQKLSNLKMALPGKILLVKTTGREEANAAYCRSTNTIVLSRRFVNAVELNSVLIHELFHIMSRNNAELREQLYALIGFKPCAPIKLPAELEARHITNPDAPHLDYFVEVTRGPQKLDVIPVLFATPERWNKNKGGEFFAYLTWKLMAIHRAGGSSRPFSENAKVVLLNARDVSGFREQIGEQPGPVLQAEEILAEYFVKFVEGRGEVPPRVQQGMRKLLTR
jgi:hypothetical protein